MDAVDWLLVVGREKAAEAYTWTTHRRGPNPLAALPIPYAADDVVPGDRVFVSHVAFTGRRFELLGRLEVRTVSPVARDPRGAVLVRAKHGTASRTGPVVLDREIVDALRFTHMDCSVHHVKRGPDGSVRAGQFGGRSNLRKLVAGADLLEAALR